MIAGRHSQEYPDPSQRTVEPERAMYTEVAPRGRRCRPEQFWITEIVSLVLGSGSFVAILAILGAFEGGLQPNWRHGITINAVIAVLATTLRACLVVVAEQGELEGRSDGTAGRLRVYSHKPGQMAMVQSIATGQSLSILRLS